MNVRFVFAVFALACVGLAHAGIDSPFDRDFGTKEYHGGADRLIGERAGQRRDSEPSDGNVSTGVATQGPTVPAFGQAFKDNTVVKTDAQIKAEAAQAEAEKQAAVAGVETEQVEVLKALAAEDQAAGAAAAEAEKTHLNALNGQTRAVATVDLAKSTGNAAIAVRSGKADKIGKATAGVVKSLNKMDKAVQAESAALSAVEDKSLYAAHQQASTAQRNGPKYAELIAQQEKEAAAAQESAEKARLEAIQAQAKAEAEKPRRDEGRAVDKPGRDAQPIRGDRISGFMEPCCDE